MLLGSPLCQHSKSIRYLVSLNVFLCSFLSTIIFTMHNFLHVVWDPFSSPLDKNKNFPPITNADHKKTFRS